MDFSFSPEQQKIIDDLKALLLEIYPEEMQDKDSENGTFPWQAWKRLADEGYLRLGLPESVGGKPCDTLTLAMVTMVLSRYGGALCSMFCLGIPTMFDICKFGRKSQIEKYVGGYIKGGPCLCLGISEPTTGSDVAGMLTNYYWDGDTAVINGMKHYTTGGDVADAMILIARDKKSKQSLHRCGTMFLVDLKTTPGVTIERLPKFGHYDDVFTICKETFTDVRLPRSAVLGREHNGFMQTMANFGRERVANCAASIGTAINCFEDACKYANKREQFGQPIGNFQLIQEKIMNMSVKIENMMNMLFKICWKIDNKMDVRIDTGMAKYYTPKTCCEIVDDALQILAGTGIVGSHRVAKLYISGRGARLGGGSDEIMIHNTVPEILKMYK